MSDKKPIRIGTRGSNLALWQSRHVAALLEEATGRPAELTIIKTTGDKILDVPLAKIGDKGLFVKEIENALLADEVDIAVHSMKDMPTVLPEGCVISAALIRENPRDALILPGGAAAAKGRGGREILASLPEGARIGTSSLRRRSQLFHLRSDLDILDLRGNLDTRLRKLDEGEYDAIILAGAGVRRLGLADRITVEIPADIIMPAVGQGAIAIEIHESNTDAQALSAIIDHSPTHLAIRAERALMRQLEGGCQVPIGALAQLTEVGLEMRSIIASLDGQTVLRADGSGDPHDPEALGIQLAAQLVELGAGAILDDIRHEPGSSFPDVTLT